MSRIIKSIIDNVIGSDCNQYLYYHNNKVQDIELINLIGGTALTFRPNSADLNKKFHLIDDKIFSNNLTISPRFIVNTSLMNYQQVNQVSNLLYIPVFNILEDINNIKKEGMFSLATDLDKDINLLFKKDLAEKLFINNYTVIDNIQQIPTIIREKLKTWTPT